MTEEEAERKCLYLKNNAENLYMLGPTIHVMVISSAMELMKSKVTISGARMEKIA